MKKGLLAASASQGPPVRSSWGQREVGGEPEDQADEISATAAWKATFSQEPEPHKGGQDLHADPKPGGPLQKGNL